MTTHYPLLDTFQTGFLILNVVSHGVGFICLGFPYKPGTSLTTNQGLIVSDLNDMLWGRSGGRKLAPLEHRVEQKARFTGVTSYRS